MMNEDAVMIIHNYIDVNLFPPARSWSEYEFRKRSYERCAANEIIKRIEETSETDPFFVILYFRYQMDTLLNICENSASEFIFITARDIADEIILLF